MTIKEAAEKLNHILKEYPDHADNDLKIVAENGQTGVYDIHLTNSTWEIHPNRKLLLTDKDPHFG